MLWGRVLIPPLIDHFWNIFYMKDTKQMPITEFTEVKWIAKQINGKLQIFSAIEEKEKELMRDGFMRKEIKETQVSTAWTGKAWGMFKKQIHMTAVEEEVPGRRQARMSGNCPRYVMNLLQGDWHDSTCSGWRMGGPKLGTPGVL